MAYVYLKSKPGVWTVGHYAPNGTWHPESDYPTPEAAAGRVMQLNGTAHEPEAYNWMEDDERRGPAKDVANFIHDCLENGCSNFDQSELYILDDEYTDDHCTIEIEYGDYEVHIQIELK